MEHLLSVHVRLFLFFTLLTSDTALQNQILGTDDRNNWNELQSNFCSVVIVCSSVVMKYKTHCHSVERD
jgi:hypothetical protein